MTFFTQNSCANQTALHLDSRCHDSMIVINPVLTREDRDMREEKRRAMFLNLLSVMVEFSPVGLTYSIYFSDLEMHFCLTS